MRYLALFLALFTLATPALAVDLINTLPGSDGSPWANGNYDFLPNRAIYQEGQSFKTTASDYTVTSVTVALAWQWDVPNQTNFDYSISLAEFNTFDNQPGSVIASQTFNTSGLNDQTYTNVTWNPNQTLSPNTQYFVTVAPNAATGLQGSNAGLLWGYSNGSFSGWLNDAGVAPVGGSYWSAVNPVWQASTLNYASSNFPQLVRVSTDAVTAVPEPSTYVSALLGVGAVVLARRHRRAKK